MYIDGFVMAVPADKKEEFAKFCKLMKEIAMEHDVLSVVDGWGDDVPKGEVTDMYRAVQAKEGEIIVFSWMTWADKQARDAAMKPMMEDPRINGAELPFDGKRCIFGGFQALEY